MQIAKIMSNRPVSVSMDDTLLKVREIFNNTRFHHLLVVENDKLVGVMSDRDLLKAISPHIGTPNERQRDLATLNRKVHQVMSRSPVVLQQNSTIMEAVILFNRRRLSCLPVVDQHKRPIGIVTWRDLMKHLESQYVKRKKNAATELIPTSSNKKLPHK